MGLGDDYREAWVGLSGHLRWAMGEASLGIVYYMHAWVVGGLGTGRFWFSTIFMEL